MKEMPHDEKNVLIGLDFVATSGRAEIPTLKLLGQSTGWVETNPK